MERPKRIKRYLSQIYISSRTDKAGRAFAIYKCEVEYEDGSTATIEEEVEDTDDVSLF